MENAVFSPSLFVASINQTLEFAYPTLIIEGELANFRISKNKWVYFNLKDEEASVAFFGSIYQLPGPLQDGLMLRVIGSPRMHSRFGFSVNFQSILPVGEGSIRKAADLLAKKLEAEGLFATERKRLLPHIPLSVGLITAADSAAAADFVKILNERWGGVNIQLLDVLVQGDSAPVQIVEALEYFNQISEIPEVIVITRGGGSAEDLAAFSDERVVRAVAASRIPTLVAVGHEIDISLAELAADQRASTPTNAAQILVPDKSHELANLLSVKSSFLIKIDNIFSAQKTQLDNQTLWLNKHIDGYIKGEYERLKSTKQIINLFNPSAALKRGYALVQKEGKYLKSVNKVKEGDLLNISLVDGTIRTEAQEVSKHDG